MRTDRSAVALRAASAAYLCVAAVGWATAIRRGHPADILGWRGRVESIRRDALVVGTALSPPAWMLGLQLMVTIRRDERARRTLRVLGATVVSGHGGEALVRRRLHPAHVDPLETTLAVAGIGLGLAMATGASLRRHPRV